MFGDGCGSTTHAVVKEEQYGVHAKSTNSVRERDERADARLAASSARGCERPHHLENFSVRPPQPQLTTDTLSDPTCSSPLFIAENDFAGLHWAIWALDSSC